MVIENVKVRCQHLNSKRVVEQELGGGVWMPETHWQVVKNKLEGKEE